MAGSCSRSRAVNQHCPQVSKIEIGIRRRGRDLIEPFADHSKVYAQACYWTGCIHMMCFVQLGPSKYEGNMSLTKKIAASDTPEANWLLSGTGWDLFGTARGLPNGVLTYSFPDSSSDYGKGNTNGFEAFQDPQKVAVRSIFEGLEALTNANFVEVTATGGLKDLDGASSFNATDGSAILH